MKMEMDENKSPQSGTSTTVSENQERSGGHGSESRETMKEGSSSVADGTEGEADTGREPEYYGEKHDPA